MEFNSELKLIAKKLTPITIISGIVAALAGIGIAYVFVVNNVYRPDVKIISVDWVAGTAVICIGKHQKTLYAGSTLSVGLGEWGVMFAGDGNTRIELIKNGLTYKTISNK